MSYNNVLIKLNMYYLESWLDCIEKLRLVIISRTFLIVFVNLNQGA